jgi:hypothetical protein
MHHDFAAAAAISLQWACHVMPGSYMHCQQREIFASHRLMCCFIAVQVSVAVSAACNLQWLLLRL